MSFLTPYAGLVALLVLVPLAAFAIGERGRRRVTAVLHLPEPGRGWRAAAAVAVTAVAALLGLAATQPTLVRHVQQHVRSDAEAWFVLDTSLSMSASERAGGASRFRRSQALAERFRDELNDVPIGLASITDRAMPHLFPSPDRTTFRSTLYKSMGIERPPPSDGFSILITTLGSLSRLASDNFFSRTATRRLMIVFTDGETKPFVDRSLATLFRRPPGVRTIFVHVWQPDEHVFVNGVPDPLYRPVPRSGAYVRAIASATGGDAFGESDVKGILDRARSDLGSGPKVALAHEQEQFAMAPWIAGLAFLPLAFLLWRRNF
jgi:von Willebrand factor type A domain